MSRLFAPVAWLCVLAASVVPAAAQDPSVPSGAAAGVDGDAEARGPAGAPEAGAGSEGGPALEVGAVVDEAGAGSEGGPSPAEAGPAAGEVPVAGDSDEDVERPSVALEVEATADVSAAAPPPASIGDFELSPGLLRDVPRASAEAWLTLAPSAFLVNHSGTYHASTILLRGFDAGEGQDLEVLVDGVPINDPSNAHGHGYADTHFVIPELVSRVRVLEGPFAPEQSDFAVAGSAEHSLGTSERGIRLEAGYGSFDARRLLLVLAPHGARDGTFVGVDLRDSAGFGTNRSSASAAAMARLELEVTRDLTFHVLAAGHFAQFDAAGVLRASDVAGARLPCASDADAQFFCAADPGQGGASARALVSMGLVWHRPHERLEATLYGGYRSLRLRENFTGLLLDDRGDGLDAQYAVGMAGMRGRYRAEAEILGRTQRFELGWVLGHRSGDSRQWRLRRSDGVPHTAVFDDELHLTHVGVHVAAELSLAAWLDVRVGVRADAFAFSTVERARPEVDRMGMRLPASASDALGLAIQPRGTVHVHLLPELSWQTSAGVGTRSSDAIALSEGELAPFAEAIALETGLRLEVHEGPLGLDARLAAYHTHVDRDLVFDPNLGRNVELGASSRLGALAYVRAEVARWLDVAASFAWNEAFLLAPGAPWTEWASSTRMPYVPRWVGRLDAAVAQPIAIEGDTLTLAAAVGVGWLGERPLPLSAVAEQVVLVDASVRVRWRLFELGVAVQNLLDVRWQSSQFNYASRWDAGSPASLVPAAHFAAGAPLSVMARLSVFFDETNPLASLEAVPGTAPSAAAEPVAPAVAASSAAAPAVAAAPTAPSTPPAFPASADVEELP